MGSRASGLVAVSSAKAGLGFTGLRVLGFFALRLRGAWLSVVVCASCAAISNFHFRIACLRASFVHGYVVGQRGQCEFKQQVASGPSALNSPQTLNLFRLRGLDQPPCSEIRCAVSIQAFPNSTEPKELCRTVCREG